MRVEAKEYEHGEVSREDYDFGDMMQRNRISNLAFIAQSAGEIIILAVLVGILFALNINEGVTNDDRGLSVLIAYATAVWIVLAITGFGLDNKDRVRSFP